ncbi:hypothetical protein O181_049473 [Austropuccinia psidii MF-1]|uniref:Sodium/calcium exchanger membrane region domain-containing protein n=1 Tax=Austropuccinia psidii MF-1 TaxID=1389203 RepID=A0A9Q3DZY3_9BASI|nr:hypothetical protein [Austropuccinia psidii MF-1]
MPIRLGLSESLAGVTLLGFGTGAPDVFSTFAAMNANTGSLAIDGKIKRWEANTSISLYLIYVLSVLISNWSIQKKFKSKQSILKVRNEYSQENPPLEPFLMIPDSNLENRRSSLDHDQPNPSTSVHPKNRPQLSPTQKIPAPNFHQSFPTSQNSNEPFKNLLEANFYFPSSGLNC